MPELRTKHIVARPDDRGTADEGLGCQELGDDVDPDGPRDHVDSNDPGDHVDSYGPDHPAHSNDPDDLHGDDEDDASASKPAAPADPKDRTSPGWLRECLGLGPRTLVERMRRETTQPDWFRRRWSDRWVRPNIDDPHNLGILLRQAAATITTTEREIIVRAVGSDFTLDVHDIDMLRALHDRYRSPSELAELLTMSRSRTSTRLRALESSGLIERGDNEYSTRHVRVDLTEAGERVVARMDEELAELHDLLGDDIPPDAMTTLLATLAFLADPVP